MRIILFRSNNIFDSRVNKYHNYYEQEGFNYTIVGWDRKGEGVEKEHYDFFKYEAGEDIGGLRAIRNHFKWIRFVFHYLRKNRDVTTIHACDLNSAFPAAIYKAVFKRNVVLIFDACDWFSANFVHYKVLKLLFEIMERFSYKWADELIICEPERKDQIQFKLKKEPLVLRNIPEIDNTLITGVQERYVFNNTNPTIVYMGGFVRSRFLSELLWIVETERCNLLIAGYGDKDIIRKCQELNDRENVKYFGRVNMIDGLNMENAADIIYAMYCKDNPNHIFAAPNKYYEALLLGKPLITTRGTIVGDKVEKYDTGWAIEENIHDLIELIRNMTPEEMENKGKNATVLWERDYKMSISNFFKNDYSRIIQ